MASIPDPPVDGGETVVGHGATGDYDVGVVLREGWGGTIREGTYRPTGRRVTVEAVRPDLAATPGVLDRLGRFGREAATLRDPHLLAVYDLLEGGGTLELIGEWSDGATVAATLDSGSMTPERTLAALADVLAGLEALHAHGLFHGQVGPETIVVDAGGRARLAELALCAAAAPAGFGPQGDVRDTARLGLHLLRKAGSRYGPVRRVLEGAATAAQAPTAPGLRAELDRAATAVLGPRRRDGPVSRPGPGSRGRRRLILALIVAALVAAAAVAAVILLTGRNGPARSSTAPLAVGGDTSMSVTPATAGCNTTFAFLARGSLTGVGNLVYRWEQSDGQATSDTTLPINASEGSFELHQAWRLQGSQKVDGTMTLHLLKPLDRKISQTFHYSCP